MEAALIILSVVIGVQQVALATVTVLWWRVLAHDSRLDKHDEQIDALDQVVEAVVEANKRRQPT